MRNIYLEHSAEDLIAHKLQQAHFLVAKPKFDIFGTDLIIFYEFNDSTKIGRAQCKGRSILVEKKQGTSIKIPIKYVNGAFFCFLYFELKDPNSNVYMFTAKEIISLWKKTKNEKEYILSITPKMIREDKIIDSLEIYLFNETRIEILKKIINSSKSDIEYKLLEIASIQTKQIENMKTKYELEKLINEYNYNKNIIKMSDDHIYILNSVLQDGYKEELKKIPREIKEKMILEYEKQKNIKEVLNMFRVDLKNYINTEIIEDVLSYLLEEKAT